MANIQAGDRFKAPYAGDLGNQSTWSGYHKMPVAGAIGDTIELFEVPAGAKIDEVSEVHSAHGGSATLAIGWKYKDGSAGGSATALKAAATSVAAGNSTTILNPMSLFPNNGGVVDAPIVVYVTNAGSAIPQNGDVYVRLSGEFVGTK